MLTEFPNSDKGTTKSWKAYLCLHGTSSIKSVKVKVLVDQSCPTICDPMDYSPPGFSVHGILQARILEWVAISFSKRPSRPRDQTRVSCIGRQILYHWATRESPRASYTVLINSQMMPVLLVRVPHFEKQDFRKSISTKWTTELTVKLIPWHP